MEYVVSRVQVNFHHSLLKCGWLWVANNLLYTCYITFSSENYCSFWRVIEKHWANIPENTPLTSVIYRGCSHIKCNHGMLFRIVCLTNWYHMQTFFKKSFIRALSAFATFGAGILCWNYSIVFILNSNRGLLQILQRVWWFKPIITQEPPSLMWLTQHWSMDKQSYLLIYEERNYRKISNIRRTKSQNLIVSRLVLQLCLPNPTKPCVKSRMKM